MKSKYLYQLSFICFFLFSSVFVLADELAVPTGLPIEVSPGNNIELGTVYSNEVRNFQYSLKNISGESLTYNKIILSCACSRLELTVPGEIEAGKDFIVPVELDARKLTEKAEFKKTIRFFFTDGRILQLSFSGTKSDEIKFYAATEEKQEISNLELGFIEPGNDSWQKSFEIKAEFADKEEKLEIAALEFTNEKLHKGELRKLAENHWKVTLLPQLPQELGMMNNEVILKLNSVDSTHSLRLKVEGMIGTELDASTYEILWIKEKDPVVVTKSFALSRVPFNARAIRAAMFFGKKNPYVNSIKVLKVEEVILPTVPGVDFELKQGKGGVYVICNLNAEKMSEEEIVAEFAAENAKATNVFFRKTDKDDDDEE